MLEIYTARRQRQSEICIVAAREVSGQHKRCKLFRRGSVVFEKPSREIFGKIGKIISII